MTSIIEQEEVDYISSLLPDFTSLIEHSKLHLELSGKISEMPIYILNRKFYAGLDLRLLKYDYFLDNKKENNEDVLIYANGPENNHGNMLSFSINTKNIFQYSISFNDGVIDKCYFISDPNIGLNYLVIPTKDNEFILQFICSQSEERVYYNKIILGLYGKVGKLSILHFEKIFQMPISGTFSGYCPGNSFNIGTSLGTVPPNFQVGNLLALCDSKFLADSFQGKTDWGSYIGWRKSVYYLIEKAPLYDIDSYYKFNLANKIKGIIRKKLYGNI